MLRHAAFLAGCLAFAPTLFPAGTSAQSSAQARQTSLILGRVVDASTGAPLAGAVVILEGHGEQVAVSTASGQFVFSGLHAGAYELTASKGGFHDAGFGQVRVNGSTQSVTLRDSERRTDVVVRMWRVSAITGTVRDEAGEPVVGVPVQALRTRYVAGRPHSETGHTMEATTDDRGVYRLGALEPGEHVVTVPFVETSAPKALLDDLEARKAAIATSAAAGDHEPPGSLQALWNLGMSGSGPGSASVIADGDWIRSLEPMGLRPPPTGADGRPFTYRTVYYPAAQSEHDARPIALAAGEERTGVDFVFSPVRGTRITGTVTGPDGPGANLAIALLAIGSDGAPSSRPVAKSITDAGGRFRFPAVAPGSYRAHVLIQPSHGLDSFMVVSAIGVSGDGAVTLSSSGTLAQALRASPQTSDIFWGHTDVTVANRDVTGINLTLQRGAKVRGTIVLEGATADELAEFAKSSTLSALVASGRPPVVTSAFDETHTQTNADIEKDGTFTMELPPGAYVFRTSTAAFEGAVFDERAEGGLGAVSISFSDSLSTWTIDSIDADGRNVADEPLQVGNRDVSGVVVRLTKRSARISGRVRRADGGSPADATVILFPTLREWWQDYGATGWWRVRTTRVTSEGDYDFSHLPPGEYYVVAASDDPPADALSVERLEQLSRTASTITVTPGETRTVPLEVR